MNGLKHILVMVALLVSSALPHVHAEDHHDHVHEADVQEQLCASHVCACTSCDDASCIDELEVERKTGSISVAVMRPSTDIILFVFTEPKPVLRRGTYPVHSALSALKTVHLLI